jgi:hypothetical protein
VVIRAAWVKSRPASRTGISATKILSDRQSFLTFATEYRVRLTLVLAPNQRCVASPLLVAMDAGIKRVAALEFNGHNVAVGVVVRTLSLLIDAGAVHNHLTRTRSATALHGESSTGESEACYELRASNYHLLNSTPSSGWLHCSG